jgi:hypothetical protein
MTPEQIRAAIAARPELAGVTDSQALADALSVGRTRLAPTTIGRGQVIIALDLDAGNALLDHLRAVPRFRHVWPLIEAGELRLDLPQTVAMLDSLVGVTLDDGTEDGLPFLESHRSALMTLATRPDPVDEMSVRRAIWADDGTLLI